MSKIRLSLAISDYDHVRDLTSGAVACDGVDLVPLDMPVEEIFYRFIAHREWDVSEMSFAKYVAMTAAGTADFQAIPVFPSRMFRLSSIYVPADSALSEPGDLAGRRVGIPEWAQTAAVYTRGWLSETEGVPLSAIKWLQAGVNDPGRAEKVAVSLPKGVTCTAVPDASLSSMLLDGRIDAAFSAHPPAPFEDGSGRVRHLLPDFRTREEAYYRATSIFPIMHVIAIRKDVLSANPWVARNLLKAFSAARDASVTRLREFTASRVPLPWGAALAAEAENLFGELFPYGLEPNRATIEAFLRFCHAQGLTARRLEPEELFVPTTLGGFRT